MVCCCCYCVGESFDDGCCFDGMMMMRNSNTGSVCFCLESLRADQWVCCSSL